MLTVCECWWCIDRPVCISGVLTGCEYWWCINRLYVGALLTVCGCWWCIDRLYVLMVLLTVCECWWCIDRLYMLIVCWSAGSIGGVLTGYVSVMWGHAVSVDDVLTCCEYWCCVFRLNGEGVEVTEKCGPVVYGQHALFCRTTGRRELVSLLHMPIYFPIFVTCIKFSAYHICLG